MFIIQYLPEMVIHIIFTLGVLGTIVGFVLGFIRFVKTYKIAIQVVALVVLVIGAYLQGALAESKAWQQRVLELEVKLKDAELKSAKVNTVIQQRVVTKTRVVKEKADEIIKYIDRDVVKREEVVKYVERCSLPDDIVEAHNKAIDELNEAGKKK